jgi:hydrophobe/amphiphile efflux-1 (HAE1) family protein
VVDDAIVVVENVERHLSDGATPREAALKTMAEVGGALVSIALVLSAVFIPTAFLSGISGEFFKQFAVTIAAATLISLFNSLTLSPALASLILRKHEAEDPAAARENRATRWLNRFFDRFNAGFARTAAGYGRTVDTILRHRRLMIGIYLVLIVATAWVLIVAPKGFIPAQDRGYVVISVQLPGGASLARTTEVVRKVEAIALGTPGVARVPSFAGFSGATRTLSTSAAALFPVFEPWPERASKGLTNAKIVAELNKRLATVDEAFLVILQPPRVPGIGTGGGFEMRLEDRASRGTALLDSTTQELVAAARKTPGLAGVFSPFSTNTPQLFVSVDRARAQMLAVPIDRVSEAIETYFGSTYVNDFNILGRTYQVTAQADFDFRRDASDLMRVRTRSDRGQMVPLGSLVDISDRSGPDRVPRYNLYPATEIKGEGAPGVSTTRVLALMERLAANILPDGIFFEWTDLSYSQTTSGNAGLYIFPLCVLFVYLVLAAQYGSWSLPLSILLIVPMCLLAASLGVRLLGQDVNVLTQIGFIVLVGLAAKNAILIVEFAKQQEEDGKARIEAILEACRLRLRPILMTSFAFILGVLPLVLSSGAGSEMRQAVGTAVFFGMIGVTIFGLIFTPIFYVLIRGLADARQEAAARTDALASSQGV